MARLYVWTLILLSAAAGLQVAVPSDARVRSNSGVVDLRGSAPSEPGRAAAFAVFSPTSRPLPMLRGLRSAPRSTPPPAVHWGPEPRETATAELGEAWKQVMQELEGPAHCVVCTVEFPADVREKLAQLRASTARWPTVSGAPPRSDSSWK